MSWQGSGFGLSGAACAGACLALALGCTCTPSHRSESSGGQADDTAAQVGQLGEVTSEVGTAVGPLPVTLVLDPTGALCQPAARFGGGRRHILCDRTQKEDLSAGALRGALTRFKLEHGPAVASGSVWLLASPARAAVARSLALHEPAFFSRVAVWVGDSPAAASLFGPTFWHEVAKGTVKAVLLLGPAARSGESWTGLAQRRGARLRVDTRATVQEDSAAWSMIEAEFTSE